MLEGRAAQADEVFASSERVDRAATIEQTGDRMWRVRGDWTLSGLSLVSARLAKLSCESGSMVLDGTALTGLDSAGVWLLQRWLAQHAVQPNLQNWRPRWRELMTLAEQSSANQGHANQGHADSSMRSATASRTQQLGRAAVAIAKEAHALLRFVGECAARAVVQLIHPRLIRWRAVLRTIQISGFDALPIIGMTSLLLGVVIAYQGADQLKHYGANIFVVDLIGYAMLREFAPLISAIIIAGRSGSAYAAQIGTMMVTEEVDAMRTLGIEPIDVLVLPKLAGLILALPLLTIFADTAGVFGGMLMASSQLGIGYSEFIDRFGREIHGASLFIGIGKSLVFAGIIAIIGCFQGFRTRGSADSVGRQTTASVVQSIFFVIVVDALFSVAFSVLDI